MIQPKGQRLTLWKSEDKQSNKLAISAVWGIEEVPGLFLIRVGRRILPQSVAMELGPIPKYYWELYNPHLLSNNLGYRLDLSAHLKQTDPMLHQGIRVYFRLTDQHFPTRRETLQAVEVALMLIEAEG